jgi:hypothetical protein
MVPSIDRGARSLLCSSLLLVGLSSLSFAASATPSPTTTPTAATLLTNLPFVASPSPTEDPTIKGLLDVALALETVDSFDGTKQQSFKIALALVLGISDIALTVAPAGLGAGIIVSAEVRMHELTSNTVEATIQGPNFEADLRNNALTHGNINELSVDVSSYTVLRKNGLPTAAPTTISSRRSKPNISGATIFFGIVVTFVFLVLIVHPVKAYLRGKQAWIDEHSAATGIHVRQFIHALDVHGDLFSSRNATTGASAQPSYVGSLESQQEATQASTSVGRVPVRAERLDQELAQPRDLEEQEELAMAVAISHSSFESEAAERRQQEAITRQFVQ